MKAIIIAGGKGKRLEGITKDIPKPMFPINGLPVLLHQINLAKRYNIREFIILTGHLAYIIEDYFGDGGKFGVKISYFREDTPMGTAGCLKLAQRDLDEDFFLFYGDTIFNIDLQKMVQFHFENRGMATLLVHPNDHPYDSDLVDIYDQTKRISTIYLKPHPPGVYRRNLASAALYVLSPEILNYFPFSIPLDFMNDIFPLLIKENKNIFAYLSSEYIKDMGTPDRLKRVERDLQEDKIW